MRNGNNDIAKWILNDNKSPVILVYATTREY